MNKKLLKEIEGYRVVICHLCEELIQAFEDGTRDVDKCPAFEKGRCHQSKFFSARKPTKCDGRAYKLTEVKDGD